MGEFHSGQVHSEAPVSTGPESEMALPPRKGHLAAVLADRAQA
jgi:hypothetical protein